MTSTMFSNPSIHHHNILDPVEAEMIFGFIFLSCIIVGYYINKLLKKEEDFYE